ncbi:MAG: hypothetical protein KF819_34835 [Labilithrix sp.]|nr:hypothetical protein [Labilithrix sp.]
MIGLILALVFGAALRAVVNASGERATTLGRIVMGGYFLRLAIQFVIREIPFFSHGLGGDSATYEEFGRMIAASWRNFGFHFVTAEELPLLGPTSLPPNLFAVLIYANGGEATQLGCTALVALAAGLTVLNVFKLSSQFGAERGTSLLFASILYFQPAFLFYTCDTYKDGLVLCFAIGALGSALRLSQRLSIVHALVGLMCVAALWYVRFYLVFVAVGPLVVGLAGVGSKNLLRPVAAAVVIATISVALASFTDILQMAADRASQTFEVGTATYIREANAAGGSGVMFDDGGVPYAALPQKLAYTVFAPFLWEGGSLGFQLGKVDVLLWYFIIYRAFLAARQTDRRLLLMLLTFIVPSTLMYAMSMANVGLIVRQRLVIVAATAILAATYKPKPKAAEQPLKAGFERPRAALDRARSSAR